MPDLQGAWKGPSTLHAAGVSRVFVQDLRFCGSSRQSDWRGRAGRGDWDSAWRSGALRRAPGAADVRSGLGFDVPNVRAPPECLVALMLSSSFEVRLEPLSPSDLTVAPLLFFGQDLYND